MKDAEIIRHYHNLIKLIKAFRYWAPDQNFELVVLYVNHVIEGKPIDEFSKPEYKTMLSMVNEENKESNEDT